MVFNLQYSLFIFNCESIKENVDLIFVHDNSTFGDKFFEIVQTDRLLISKIQNIVSIYKSKSLILI